MKKQKHSLKTELIDIYEQPCLLIITQYFIHSGLTKKISKLFQSHVYDSAGSFVCPKNIIAVFLTALEGSL